MPIVRRYEIYEEHPAAQSYKPYEDRDESNHHVAKESGRISGKTSGLPRSRPTTPAPAMVDAISHCLISRDMAPPV